MLRMFLPRPRPRGSASHEVSELLAIRAIVNLFLKVVLCTCPPLK